MRILSLVGLGLAGLLFGCAHSAMRGSVAMKATDEEVHVCMGEGEVKAGDRVAFLLSRCPRGGPKEIRKRVCDKLFKLGEGEVIRVLNEHYSIVRPNPGFKVEEGMVVEKL